MTTSRSRRVAVLTAIPIALTLVASLVGCSEPLMPMTTPGVGEPSQAAEPSSPPSSEPTSEPLALTADGLGDLRIGAPISTSLFEFRPEYCRETYPEQEWTDQHAGEWVPTGALTGAPAGDGPAVEIYEGDGVLTIVQIQTDDVLTPEGIGLGSTADEVSAAYPAATVDQSGGLSDLVVVPGQAGSLLIEIASPRAGENYWPAGQVGRVVHLRSVLTEPSLVRLISGSDGYGYCQL